MNESILINLSKIGKHGTGMYNFSNDVLSTLADNEISFDILASKGVSYVHEEKNRIEVPEWVSSGASVSVLRPVLWQFYMMTAKYPYKYALSTTHHFLPQIHHQIATVHDLRPYYYPDSVSQKIYFHCILPKKIKKSDGIFTVSETTKKAIHSVYGVPSDKIHVIGNIVDTTDFAFHEGGKREKYLLAVGATWKHKNIIELIENSKFWEKKYNLVIVSGEGKYHDLLCRKVKEMDLGTKTKFLSFVERDKLISLYQKASALVFPSIDEGFGIPPLEAMSCGTPAIVSDIPVFREIYEAAPIYVKLGDKESWKMAFEKLEDKDLLSEKQKLGFMQAKKYTRERFESRLMTALDDVWPELDIKRNME